VEDGTQDDEGIENPCRQRHSLLKITIPFNEKPSAIKDPRRRMVSRSVSLYQGTARFLWEFTIVERSGR